MCLPAGTPWWGLWRHRWQLLVHKGVWLNRHIFSQDGSGGLTPPYIRDAAQAMFTQGAKYIGFALKSSFFFDRILRPRNQVMSPELPLDYKSPILLADIFYVLLLLTVYFDLQSDDWRRNTPLTTWGSSEVKFCIYDLLNYLIYSINFSLY